MDIYDGNEIAAIDAALDALLDVDPETGEVREGSGLLIEAVKVRLAEQPEARIEWWLQHRANLLRRSEARQAEANRIELLADRDRTKARRLEESIRFVMGLTGLRKLECDSGSVAVVRNGGKQPVDIMVPAEQLPDEYKVVKVTVSPDREAILQDLQRGKAIDGCALMERGEHLRFQ